MTRCRYWTQAAGQLEGSGITLMKDGAPGVEGWDQWLSRHAPDGSSVGINGRSLSVRTADRLTGLLTPKGISLREDLDLPSQIWNDRPAMPSSTVFAHTRPNPVRANSPAWWRSLLRLVQTPS